MSDSPNGNGAEEAKNNGNGNGNGAVERSESVVISDPTSGEMLELPTNPDNSLYLATLQSNVSGSASGLKYKNPKTGASRAVIVDPTGTKFLPPSDGWDDKVFQVIMAATPARSSEVSVKRRKMGDSDGEEDSDGEGRHGRKRLLESGPRERRPVDLIVLGVNYKTTDETFKTYFEQFGGVSFAEIKRTPEGTSKGFGFVQMATYEDQEKVLNQAAHMLDGRRCEVRVPDQRGGGGMGGPGEYGKAPSRSHISKIFVGRLTDKITDTQLREFFDAEAKKNFEGASILDVFIPKPFRGFGFVTFSHCEVAEKLSKTNTYVIDGTSVAVSLAVPRDEIANANSAAAGGYMNEFGYAYGYGHEKPARGGAAAAAVYSPYAARDPYHPAEFATAVAPGAAQPYAMRAPYEGWTQQGTPTRMSPWVNRAGTSQQQQPLMPSFPPPPPAKGSTSTSGKYAKHPDPAQHSAGNQIANGLDALNLNQKNPELLTAAWNAFYNTLHSGQSVPAPPLPPPATWPPS